MQGRRRDLYMKKFLDNKHLLWRAGFGPELQNADRYHKITAAELLYDLQKKSHNNVRPITVVDDEFTGIISGMRSPGKPPKALSPEERKMIREKSRNGIRDLNLLWMNEMVSSEQQLREKTSLFWHGHFACRSLNVLYQQQLLEIIRNNALGNFGELLRAVSKSAAMINFLNNNQNRKDHPNENFARELMELFTLGRGNYTEKDVKEAARAFTGWKTSADGTFAVRKGNHDNGIKQFLGRAGNFDGDDIISILLEKKETALFITGRIFRFFVDDQPDPSRIQWLADRFFQGGYNISELLNDIFSSEWFFDSRHIGSRIKSPVELLVGIRRAIPMSFQDENSQIIVQRVLGQVLFLPPNVAGWPGGKSWIDSSSLMFRMNLPELLASSRSIDTKTKDDDDIMMGRGMVKNAQAFRAAFHWENYLQHFEKTKRDGLLNAVASYHLQLPGNSAEKITAKFADQGNRESFIQSATLYIMSTPEYQLC